MQTWKKNETLSRNKDRNLVLDKLLRLSKLMKVYPSIYYKLQMRIRVTTKTEEINHHQTTY